MTILTPGSKRPLDDWAGGTRPEAQRSLAGVHWRPATAVGAENTRVLRVPTQLLVVGVLGPARRASIQ